MCLVLSTQFWILRIYFFVNTNCSTENQENQSQFKQEMFQSCNDAQPGVSPGSLLRLWPRWRVSSVLSDSLCQSLQEGSSASLIMHVATGVPTDCAPHSQTGLSGASSHLCSHDTNSTKRTSTGKFTFVIQTNILLNVKMLEGKVEWDRSVHAPPLTSLICPGCSASRR